MIYKCVVELFRDNLMTVTIGSTEEYIASKNLKVTVTGIDIKSSRGILVKNEQKTFYPAPSSKAWTDIVFSNRIWSLSYLSNTKKGKLLTQECEKTDQF